MVLRTRFCGTYRGGTPAEARFWPVPAGLHPRRRDAKHVDLTSKFTRDVSRLGRHGTGDLEVQLRTPRDVERAQDLFRLSYAAA